MKPKPVKCNVLKTLRHIGTYLLLTNDDDEALDVKLTHTVFPLSVAVGTAAAFCANRQYYILLSLRISYSDETDSAAAFYTLCSFFPGPNTSSVTTHSTQKPVCVP